MALGNKLPLLSIVGASSLALACSAAAPPGIATSTSTGASSAALDAPNGGINPAAKESAAFSDPTVEALPLMDATLATTVDPSDPTAAAAATAGATAYRVALVWGHLPAPHDQDSADADPIAENWTGAVSVDAGAIGLKRTIAFDPSDHIDYPRASPQTLAFTSHTLPYVDGVLVRVVIPAGGAATLHFDTVALKTDIDLSSLATKAGGVQRLADDVEGLAWIGFPEDGCARGFVHGRWIKEEPGFGRLAGVVSDADGERLGHVRGLWGHSVKRAENVWFAKYIGAGGEARGLSFGKYGDGVFGGLWGATDEDHAIDVGTAEGFYSDGYERGDGRGVWIGRWSEKCAK